MRPSLTTSIFVMAVLACGVVVGRVQAQRTLAAFTVPPEALPSGCALKQPAPATTPARIGGVRATVIDGVSSRASFPTNPWSGSDPRTVVAVRMAMDGAPRMPDGPPLEARDAAAIELRLADHVLDAYRAAYTSADGQDVEVFAVTFDDATLARPESATATMNARGFRSRVLRGATLVLVVAPTSSACARAVDGFIQSVR